MILNFYRMSAEQKIVERITSAGTAGIKKIDLRKEFQDMEIDLIIERLVTSGDIFVDKKGTAYYCWHKDYYFQNLLNTDPKFRLIYETIMHLELSVNKTSDGLAKTMETLYNNVKNSEKSAATRSVDGILQVHSNDEPTMHLDRFRNEFDIAIGNNSSSIGWVELSKVRNELCKKHNISNEDFYNFVEQITNLYHDKYELSTGGYEGLTVRGLLHGFVRCI
jgi:hypothetical protein